MFSKSVSVMRDRAIMRRKINAKMSAKQSGSRNVKHARGVKGAEELALLMWTGADVVLW